MFQAELHNKDSSVAFIRDMEDVLTSNVFGVLKNVDSFFLNKIIENVIEVPVQREERFNVEFWPTEYKNYFDKSLAAEPDCIVSNNKYIILVEAKYYSDFGVDVFTKMEEKNQLKREVRLLAQKVKEKGLLKQDRTGYLLLVTNDLIKPTDKIKRQLGLDTMPSDVYWTNWQSINAILKQCLVEYDGKCKTSIIWIKELIELLDYKGLRDFRGYGDIGISNLAIRCIDDLCKKDILYFDRRKFDGYKSLQKYLLENNIINYENISNLFWKEKENQYVK